MAERLSGLSIEKLFNGNHDHPRIPEFIEGFSRVIGEGRSPKAMTSLGVEKDFPLRVLLGIPQKELGRKQRLLTEAYCGVFFRRNMGDLLDIWTNKPGWKPSNPRRNAAPLDRCVLDIDWMLKLGVGKSIWENDVLGSTGAFARADTPWPEYVTIRQLVLLGAYGFSDPYQFFTDATSDS